VEFHLGPIMVDGKEYESVTPLFDEIIAHRLGMIPLPTDTQLFTMPENCSCGGEGCPSCTIMYSLNKIGPCTVLSGDLLPLGDAKLKVKDEEIPVVDLAEGQAVLIYAIAKMGTAKQHVKWQVAVGVGYKYLPIVTLKDDSGEDILKLEQICPKKVFSVEKKKLKVKDAKECSLCRSCVEYAGEGAVQVEADDRNFMFTFETDGSMSAEKALSAAVSIMEKGADCLAEML
jgi:DNA-directed RNA polymerase subunit D